MVSFASLEGVSLKFTFVAGWWSGLRCDFYVILLGGLVDAPP